MTNRRRLHIALVALLTLSASACSDDDARSRPASTTEPRSAPIDTSTSTSTAAEPFLPLSEEEAAQAFVAAWKRTDRATMAEIARPDDVVDQALALGTPTGSIERFAVVGYAGAGATPQVQCFIALTNGRRAYMVMQGPGTGVNWVADYVPEEGGTDGPPSG